MLTAFFLVVALPVGTVHAEEQFSSTAKAYALIEANTKQIIASERADEKFHAAGLTKLMSYLLFYEALADGKVKSEDSVRVSQEAAKKGGTSVFLDSGASYSFETLLKPAVMCNANDAVTALAEHVGGNEAAFVTMMNERAKELGLSSTFADCTEFLRNPRQAPTTLPSSLPSFQSIAVFINIAVFGSKPLPMKAAVRPR